MIASIAGVLIHKSPQYLIVDVHGIGYQVYTSLQSFYRLPEPKESVVLHTYTYLREDTLQLYGFLTPVERETFTLLLSVSGIGPRSALNILSGLSVGDLVHAIQDGDLQKLTSVPGIGSKTAGRLTLELKDKLAGLPTMPDQVEGRPSPNSPQQQVVKDALSALVNLGYPRHQAKEVINQVCQKDTSTHKGEEVTMNLEEIVRTSLKLLSR
ncbi:MAG TPA: Holliday junction branch migration protein RuvA [Nitrospiria bacterium]|nr:Holliday junction branch migration protein RuvA [Nitrospiria bacterium]